MATTTTQYLKLRLDSNLTANARYNLNKIDALASTFIVDSRGTLGLRAVGDILVEPEALAIGGSGSGGSVDVGTPDHSLEEINLHAGSISLSTGPRLADAASGGSKHLRIQYRSDLDGAADTSDDRTVSIDPHGADRDVVLGGDVQLGGSLTTAGDVSISGASLVITLSGTTSLNLPQSGTLATLLGTETLRNKTIDADYNTISNLVHGAEVDNPSSGVHGVTGSVVGTTDTQTLSAKTISAAQNTLTDIGNDSISASAAIAYSKLNLAGSIVDDDISGSAAIQATKTDGNFGGKDLVTTGSYRLKSGAYYAALLPPDTPLEDLEWKLPATSGSSGQVLQLLDHAGRLGWASVETDALAESQIRVGSSADEAVAVDTSDVGDILADSTDGLTIKSGVISDAHVASGAAVSYSKLALSDSIVDADINSAAAIAYSKLALTGSIVDADVAADAAVAYSKLSLTGSVVDADISTSAAIALSKLAALTGSRALVSDADGEISVSDVTSTELGYLSGLTSSAQTQLDGKLDLAGGTMSGPLVLSGDAASALQPVTKQQLDAAIFGLDSKASVAVATETNITLSGEQTLDDILTSSSRVLVMGQTDPAENGIYVSAAGAWSRAEDADAWDELPGALVMVEGGTVYGGSLWMCTAAASGTLGTTDVTWTQVSGPGTYTVDGEGISLTGTQFSLELDGATLTKSGTGIKVSDGGIANTQVASGAGIAYSKLALTDSILVSDLASAAKSGTGTTVLTDTGASAAGLTLSDELTLTELASTPTTPASGKKALYAKTDGRMYTLDDSGIEQPVGAGAGSGSGTNYVDNPSTATDWTGTATITTSTSDTEVPRPRTVGTGIKIVADAGETAILTVNIDAADYELPKMLKAAYDYHLVSGDFTVDVSSFSAVDGGGTETALNLSTDSSGVTTLDVAAYSNILHAYASRTDTRSLQLKLTAGSSGGTIVLSGVEMGPGSVVTGPRIGESQTVSITEADFTNATGLTITGSVTGQPIGDSLHVALLLHFVGTGSDGSPLIMNLPSEFGDISVITGEYAGGNSRSDNDTTTSRTPNNVAVIGAGDGSIRFGTGGSTFNGSNFGNSGTLIDQIEIAAILPIAEWAGSASYNIGSDSVAYSNARYSAENSLQSIPDNSYTALIFDDNAVEEGGSNYNKSTGEFTVPATGDYFVSTMVRWNPGSVTATMGLQIQVNGVAVSQRSEVNQRNLRISDIVRADRGDVITVKLFQDSGSSQLLHTSAIFNKISIVRISDYSVNSSLLFGLATSEQAGLYQAGQAPGVADDTEAESGNVGEYLESSVISSSAVLLTDATEVVITSLEIGPGEWEVQGTAAFSGSGEPDRIIIGVSESTSLPSANSFQRTVLSSPGKFSFTTSHMTFHTGLTRFLVASGATKSIRLVVYVDWTTGTVAGYGRVWARRVR